MDEIAEDIRSVATKLEMKVLSRSEYLQHGRFSAYQIYDGGLTFEERCKTAGISCKKIEPVPDGVYFQRLEKAFDELGRYPKASERKKYGLNFSKRRYSTLPLFIEKAIELEFVPDLFKKPVVPVNVSASQVEKPQPPSGTRTDENLSVPAIPVHTRRSKWERTNISEFPYAPHDELGVVALFAVLCAKKFIEWHILELNGGKGIDATCFDYRMKREIVVELKHTFSKHNWNHRVEEDGIDYVVCWVNKWPDFSKPVISLRDLIQSKMET